MKTIPAGTIVRLPSGEQVRLMHATHVMHHAEPMVSRDHIRAMAVACAESGGNLSDCPWPRGTEAQAHFEHDFNATMRELISETGD